MNAEKIDFESASTNNMIVVAVEKDKFFIETEKQLDTTSLKAELLKDLEYQKNFRDSVLKNSAMNGLYKMQKQK